MLTKTIVNSLKAILPKEVAPTQCSFMPNQQILDNIVIMQEVLYSIRCRHLGKTMMIMKLDLEKAYDRLSWDFILDSLHDLRLPDHMVYLIMKCISSMSMRVSWNGEVTKAFAPTRGVRQRDPFSPYIFILWMERLAHKINQTVINGK